MVNRGFDDNSSILISKFPKKFLWSGTLALLKGMNDQKRRDLIIIISKMDIIKDPGS